MRSGQLVVSHAQPDRASQHVMDTPNQHQIKSLNLIKRHVSWTISAPRPDRARLGKEFGEILNCSDFLLFFSIPKRYQLILTTKMPMSTIMGPLSGSYARGHRFHRVSPAWNCSFLFPPTTPFRDG